MARLKDKVALVTGGSRGIGRAICLGFAKEGAAVGVNYKINEKAASQVTRTIKDQQGNALPFRADITKAEQVQCMIEEFVDIFGRIDIVVINAGILNQAAIINMSEKKWDEMISVFLFLLLC